MLKLLKIFGCALINLAMQLDCCNFNPEILLIHLGKMDELKCFQFRF